MTTINLDDTLINEVIAISHYQNAQEAVAKILADYLAQKKQATIGRFKKRENLRLAAWNVFLNKQILKSANREKGSFFSISPLSPGGVGTNSY